MTRKTYALFEKHLNFYDDFPRLRPALDSMLLGQLLPSDFTGDVLEMGSGVGVPAIMTGYRCLGVCVTGLEIQESLFKTAQENASLNHLEHRVFFENGDVQNPPDSIKKQEFDAVLTNPPFLHGCSSEEERDIAHHVKIPLRNWVALCAKRLKLSGFLGIVFPTESLTDVLCALEKSKMGKIQIYPLIQTSKRLVITAQKGSNSPLKLHDKVEVF
ncbi:MAG: methyltransferase [Alphaproteobacteria bacterium]|nr:methyltransferase [Alphaproteobacteria bacterium]